MSRPNWIFHKHDRGTLRIRESICMGMHKAESGLYIPIQYFSGA